MTRAEADAYGYHDGKVGAPVRVWVTMPDPTPAERPLRDPYWRGYNLARDERGAPPT